MYLQAVLQLVLVVQYHQCHPGDLVCPSDLCYLYDLVDRSTLTDLHTTFHTRRQFKHLVTLWTQQCFSTGVLWNLRVLRAASKGSAEWNRETGTK